MALLAAILACLCGLALGADDQAFAAVTAEQNERIPSEDQISAQHPCKTGAHNCDKGGHGYCEPTVVNDKWSMGYTCSCDLQGGWKCTNGCLEADQYQGHTCGLINEVTPAPSASPTPWFHYNDNKDVQYDWRICESTVCRYELQEFPDDSETKPFYKVVVSHHRHEPDLQHRYII